MHSIGNLSHKMVFFNQFGSLIKTKWSIESSIWIADQFESTAGESSVEWPSAILTSTQGRQRRISLNWYSDSSEWKSANRNIGDSIIREALAAQPAMRKRSNWWSNKVSKLIILCQRTRDAKLPVNYDQKIKYYYIKMFTVCWHEFFGNSCRAIRKT